VTRLVSVGSAAMLLGLLSVEVSVGWFGGAVGAMVLFWTCKWNGIEEVRCSDGCQASMKDGRWSQLSSFPYPETRKGHQHS
jgi:hypothetical protein